VIWDGQLWQVDDARRSWLRETGELAVMVDLGGWMLLRFRPGSGAKAAWFGVGRRDCGAAWHGLRCALFAAPAAQSVK
jgi:hypothetical protein